MRRLFLLMLFIGMAFAYTDKYTVYPNLECDNFIVNTGIIATTINSTVGVFTTGTFTTGTISNTLNYNVVTSDATLTTGNINIPIKVKGITYYLKANTGL